MKVCTALMMGFQWKLQNAGINWRGGGDELQTAAMNVHRAQQIARMNYMKQTLHYYGILNKKLNRIGLALRFYNDLG